MTVELGRRFPLHAGSSSRSILAFLPATERREFLAHHELDALTPRTITDRRPRRPARRRPGHRGCTVGRRTAARCGQRRLADLRVRRPGRRCHLRVRTGVPDVRRRPKLRPTRARGGRPDLAGPRVARGPPRRGDQGCVVNDLVRTWLYVPAHHPDRARRRSSQGRMQWSSTWRTRSRPSARTKHGRRRSRFCAICPRATTGLGAHERAGLALGPQTWPHSQAWTSTVSDCRAPRTRMSRGGGDASTARCSSCSRRRAASWRRRSSRRPPLGGRDRARRGRPRRRPAGGPDWSGLGSGWVVAVARGRPPVAGPERLHRRRRPRWPPATTAAGRDHGFFGRSVVHPRQIEPVHGAYQPTEAELGRAQEVVNAYDRARERGEAAALTPDGRFVDPAVVAGARSPSGSLPSTDRARAPQPRAPPAPRRTDDHRGAPQRATTRALIDAVRGTRTVELGHPHFTGMPCSPNHPGFRMTLIRRHGDMVRADGGSASNEIIVTGGHVGTHVDALARQPRRVAPRRGRRGQAQRGGAFSALGAGTPPSCSRAASCSTWPPPRTWRPFLPGTG